MINQEAKYTNEIFWISERERMFVCVYVCETERESEKEEEEDRERKREKDREMASSSENRVSVVVTRDEQIRDLVGELRYVYVVLFQAVDAH